MPKIAYQDGELFYTDEGKGDCLILVHGFCETHRMWDDWKVKLLEVNLRLICIDLPGFGQSSCTAKHIEEYAEAVGAIVAHAGLKKAVLVGHSMGGYISLAIAEQQPNWLQGFGLFHSHPYADSAEKQEARDRSIEFVERNGHLHYVKQLIPNFFAPDRAGSYRHQQDRLTLFASRGPAEGVTNALMAMRDRADRTAVLAQTELPVLLINGAQDQTLTEQQRQDQIALPQRVQLCYLTRAGHMGTIEAPRQTQVAVRHFVRFCQEFEA